LLVFHIQQQQIYFSPADQRHTPAKLTLTQRDTKPTSNTVDSCFKFHCIELHYLGKQPTKSMITS